MITRETTDAPCSEGEIAWEMFFLVKGTVEVVLDAGPDESVIAVC